MAFILNTQTTICIEQLTIIFGNTSQIKQKLLKTSLLSACMDQ